MEAPETFYAKLGEADIVTDEAKYKIKSFIREEWPIMAKRKGLKYRTSFDKTKSVFNTVLVGKEMPLSYCCKRNVTFVFPQKCSTNIGHVFCSNPFCAIRNVDTFAMSANLI